MPADIPGQNPIFFSHYWDMEVERSVVYAGAMGKDNQRSVFWPAYPIMNRTAFSF